MYRNFTFICSDCGNREEIDLKNRPHRSRNNVFICDVCLYMVESKSVEDYECDSCGNKASTSPTFRGM